MTSPAIHSACDHCLTGYAGVHTDQCPEFVPVPQTYPQDLRPHRDCEHCALTSQQTANRAAHGYAGPLHANGLPSYQMKPVGGACPRCGNDLPDGSFADAWTGLSVVTTFHDENGNPSQRILWVGSRARRRRAAA